MPETTQLADLVPSAPSRASRRAAPPEPRKPQVTLTEVPSPTPAVGSVATAQAAPEMAIAEPPPAAQPHAIGSAPVEMRALGQRIREPFYSQLTAVVYELGRRRVRTNKTEVLEYLLAGLPESDAALDRLARDISGFRSTHPRST